MTDRAVTMSRHMNESESQSAGAARRPFATSESDRSRPIPSEIVDGLPVLAEVRTIERAAPAALPAVQVAAVAATGFVAGAATVALVKRRAARKVARNGRVRPAAGGRPAADRRSRGRSWSTCT